jgi:hypothetical protein
MGSKVQVWLISTLGIVFLFSGMAFAKTKQINVIYQTRVGKSLKLTPGKYRIDVTKNTKMSEVQFYNRDGRLVGQVPVKVVDKSRKNNETEVYYSKLASNRQLLTEISPGGWRENLVFSHPSGNQKTAKQ